MAGRIVVRKDGQRISDYALTKSETSVGRKPDNDIWLNDTVVSRHHARIVISEQPYIEDLGSRNGMFSKGQRTKRELLQHGGVVQIGPYMLVYESDKPQPKPEPAADDTQENKNPKTQMLRAWDSSSSKAPLGMAKIVDGPGIGNILDLRDPYTAVGKMGQQVAVISRHPNGYTVRSLKGGDDCFLVNGTKVCTESHPLKDGDVVEVSEIKLEFLIIRA